MLDGNFDAVDCTENAAAEFFEAVREILDFFRGGGEQRVETIAECGIVRRKSSQYSRMINRFAERGFQFPNPRNNARVHERAEVLKAIRLVEQGAKFAQQLHMIFWEYGHVGLRQDFQQRNFKRRQRNRSIEAVATLLPLASHTRMAKQKRCDQIGLWELSCQPPAPCEPPCPISTLRP